MRVRQVKSRTNCHELHVSRGQASLSAAILLAESGVAIDAILLVRLVDVALRDVVVVGDLLDVDSLVGRRSRLCLGHDS